MIPHCGCVKDIRLNNPPCMKHSRGKNCDFKPLLNVIEEAITFCISLSGCFYFFRLPFPFIFPFFILWWEKIRPHQTVFVFFSCPPGLWQCPGDNKGKDIKAHKQHTHTANNACMCVCRPVYVWPFAFRIEAFIHCASSTFFFPFFLSYLSFF